MSLLRTVRHPVSLLATAGLFSLLLADSAEDLCAQLSFNRTFDITTTCGGNHSGRIRINGSTQPGVTREEASLPVSKVSGDVAPVSGGVVGSCSDEDEPFAVTGVTVQLPAFATEDTGAGGGGGAAGGGDGGSTSSNSAGGAGAPGFVANCRVDLKTQLEKDVPCTIDDGTDDGGDTCTVRLTAVQ